MGSRFPPWLGVLGLVAVGVYLAAATGLLDGADTLALALVFAIGPVAMAGMLGIHQRLARERDGLLLRTATTFLVVAFALFTLMVVVQQTVAFQFRDLLAGTGDPEARELLRSIRQGVNLVQLGADVAFDIFYCAGVMLLGAVMARSPAIGPVLGMAGILAAGGLLVVNLATFPYVPAESGLVDLGPVTGVWWLLVIARLVWWDRRRRARDAASGAVARPPDAAGTGRGAPTE